MEGILIVGSAIFVIACIVQVLSWRIIKIQKEIQALAFVYFLLPLIFCLMVVIATSMSWLTLMVGFTIHVFLSASLILTYPSLKADIPSVRILRYVEANPGISKRQLVVNLLRQEAFRSRKVGELIDEGLVTRQFDGLALSSYGRGIATIFHAFRRILGSSKPQG
jgi:hypothetical protein